MKKTLKVLSILLVVIILTTISTNVLAATSASGGALDPGSITATYEGSTDSLSAKAGRIMGAIRNIAAIASVIIIMVLGVKYMLGSVEEKADYKKSFMPLIIGIVLVLAATSIASFIFGMVGD